MTATCAADGRGAPPDRPLDAWLGDLRPGTFASRHLQRFPVARPGTTGAWRTLFDAEVLRRILAARNPMPDVLIVARGHLLAAPPPRDLSELGALMRRGAGLCVRHAERCDSGLAGLAASFAWLGEAHVQLFVTPGGSWGFGWHYDDEDVFIAQTAGIKDYAFRANTVAHAPPSATTFARLGSESSPLCTATLIAGDFLYLPRRWWHRARCREDALSISLGVRIKDPEAARRKLGAAF